MFAAEGLCPSHGDGQLKDHARILPPGNARLESRVLSGRLPPRAQKLQALLYQQDQETHKTSL